jgi:hypothetical protein
MRNVMRALSFAASVTLLACISFDSGSCASAQQPSSASIVGRWRSLETSKGGIGAIIEFRSDGTVDFSPGAVVETSWRIENNQLILPSATTGGAEQKYTLKWLSDNQLNLGMETYIQELARVGARADVGNPDVGNPIVGEWIESREMAGHKLEVHWLFYLGGKLLFLMPFTTQHATYTISGTALHIVMPGPKTESKTDFFELSDNLLTLSKPDSGHKDRYARY